MCSELPTGTLDDSYIPTVLTKAPWVELDGQIVVFDPTAQELLSFNSTATMVWMLCDGQTTFGEIVECLCSSYALSPEAIRADVEELLLQWIERRLLS